METNFKVDVPSFALGFNTGKKEGGSGGGGKDPILAELTVTENGVYDQPVIAGGPEPITWDGNMEGRIVLGEEGAEARYVKVSDKAIKLEDFANGCVATYSTGDVLELPSEQIRDVGNGMVLIYTIGYSLAEPIADLGAEAGTYFVIANNGVYLASLAFPAAEPIPADGWNKVTVNVAGDIIDVPELPTENVDETKIYRVQSEVQETVTEIWVVLSEEQASMMGVPSVVENGEMWRTLAGMQGGFSVNYFCHIVDELPEVGELSMVVDQNAKNMTINMYVLKGDSESRAYCYAVNGGVGEWSEYNEFGSYRGTVTVNDVSELENLRLGGEGYYIVNRNATVMRTIYGIPNAHPVKRLVDGAWVELT